MLQKFSKGYIVVPAGMGIVIFLTLFVNRKTNADLVWTLFALGGSISATSLALVEFPSLLPASWRPKKMSGRQTYQVNSWTLSFLWAAMILGIIVCAGLAVLLDPVAFSETEHGGSPLGLRIYGFILLGLSVLVAIQLIGDGSSGIRIFRDRIEVRGFGYCGTMFPKERISEIVLIDSNETVLIIKGRGERTDRIIGWLIPPRKRIRVHGSLLRDCTMAELREHFEKLGYNEKLFERFVG